MVLEEEDRPLATFITPHGRWRYIRATQGFVSSGDGYYRRFDEILTDLMNKIRWDCLESGVQLCSTVQSHDSI